MMRPVTANNFTGNHAAYSRTLCIFFALIQILFSFDFGFVRLKSRIWKILFCIITSVPVLVTLILTCERASELPPGTFIWFWLLYLVSQYFIVILILFVCNRRYSFRSFLENLFEVDREIKVYLNFWRSDLKILLSVLFVVFMKLVINIFYDYAKDFSRPEYILLGWIFNASYQVPLVLYTIIFHFLCCRMKNIHEVVKNSDFNVALAQDLYKKMYDATITCKTCFDPLFILSLVYKMPDVMLSSYTTISEIKAGEENARHHVSVNMWLLLYIIVVFTPTLFATRLSHEVNEMKVMLHDKLRTNGPNKEIERFIAYIDARPLHFTIYHIIPFNASLMFTVLNFFVTYLIIILQLSHLY